MELEKIARQKLKFGKYKGLTLQDVPDSYLRWCLDKNVLRGDKVWYARYKVNYPMNTYEVTVKDAVSGDGSYLVKAYSKNEAIKKVTKENRIQVTQSYHGTSFCASLLPPESL